MNELDIERSKINDIDKKMLDLFVERMASSRKIGLYKQKYNLNVFDASREEEIINSCQVVVTTCISSFDKRLNNFDASREEEIIKSKLSLLEDDELKEYYLEFIKDVMDISKKYQADILKDDKLK